MNDVFKIIGIIVCVWGLISATGITDLNLCAHTDKGTFCTSPKGTP